MQNDLCFAACVREHAPALLRTAYLLTGDPEDAETLVRDTFLQLYRNWDQVAATDLPMNLVRRALANQMLRQRHGASLHDFRSPNDSENALQCRAQLTDPDAIWSRLTTLPARQRTALVMRYFDDLPYEDIADAIGVRVATVRHLLRRALSSLDGQTQVPLAPNPVSSAHRPE